jgi:hypothetical protein
VFLTFVQTITELDHKPFLGLEWRIRTASNVIQWLTVFLIIKAIITGGFTRLNQRKSFQICARWWPEANSSSVRFEKSSWDRDLRMCTHVWNRNGNHYVLLQMKFMISWRWYVEISTTLTDRISLPVLLSLASLQRIKMKEIEPVETFAESISCSIHSFNLSPRSNILSKNRSLFQSDVLQMSNEPMDSHSFALDKSLSRALGHQSSFVCCFIRYDYRIIF